MGPTQPHLGRALGGSTVLGSSGHVPSLKSQLQGHLSQARNASSLLNPQRLHAFRASLKTASMGFTVRSARSVPLRVGPHRQSGGRPPLPSSTQGQGRPAVPLLGLPPQFPLSGGSGPREGPAFKVVAAREWDQLQGRPGQSPPGPGCCPVSGSFAGSHVLGIAIYPVISS